jgi:hypothetical protein
MWRLERGHPIGSRTTLFYFYDLATIDLLRYPYTVRVFRDESLRRGCIRGSP